MPTIQEDWKILTNVLYINVDFWHCSDPPAAPSIVPWNLANTNDNNEEEDEEEKTVETSPPVVLKPAKPISSRQSSMTDSESATSNEHEEFLATYNEHEQQRNLQLNNRRSNNDVTTSVPRLGATEHAISKHFDVTNQPVERSKDIHPIPPTISSVQRNTGLQTAFRTPGKKNGSPESGTVKCESDTSSESEDESSPSASDNRSSASPTTRSHVRRIPHSTPVEGVTTGQPTAAKTQNSRSISRLHTGNKRRQAVGAVKTPTSKFLWFLLALFTINFIYYHIHFIPLGQRSSASDRVEQNTGRHVQEIFYIMY